MIQTINWPALPIQMPWGSPSRRCTCVELRRRSGATSAPPRRHPGLWRRRQHPPAATASHQLSRRVANLDRARRILRRRDWVGSGRFGTPYWSIQRLLAMRRGTISGSRSPDGVPELGEGPEQGVLQMIPRRPLPQRPAVAMEAGRSQVAARRQRTGAARRERYGGYAETGMRRGLDLSPFGSVTSSTPFTRRAEIDRGRSAGRW